MANSIAAPQPIKSRSDRRLGTITYQDGTTQSLRLDADGVLHAIGLRAQFTVTGGGSNAVGIRAGALAGMFKRVELLINSNRSIINTSGPQLALRQQIENGVRGYGFDVTPVLTSAAVTVYDVRIRIPLTLPRAIAPWDTGLDMRRVQQAVLLVAWGNASDIFVTANGATISAVTCTVEGLFKKNAAGPVGFVRELIHMTQDVANTNPDLGITLDRGAYFLRSLHVLSISDGLLVNTMLDSGGLALQSGGIPFIDRVGEMIRMDQADLYGIPLAERLDGCYRLELPIDGENSTNINMAALSGDLSLRANVTKVGTTDQLQVGIERIAAHP
jgi:hypothetical protein